MIIKAGNVFGHKSMLREKCNVIALDWLRSGRWGGG